MTCPCNSLMSSACPTTATVLIPTNKWSLGTFKHGHLMHEEGFYISVSSPTKPPASTNNHPLGLSIVKHTSAATLIASEQPSSQPPSGEHVAVFLFNRLPQLSLLVCPSHKSSFFIIAPNTTTMSPNENKSPRLSPVVGS
jgi:hypothetical protein